MNMLAHVKSTTESGSSVSRMITLVKVYLLLHSCWLKFEQIFLRFGQFL